MDNEIVIHIKADDDTGRGFASARNNSKKNAKDIEGDFKVVGESIIREGAQTGMKVGSGMLGSLGQTVSKMGPALTPVIAGIGIAAAPFLGAAIAGGIIGGAGLGGVIGGVLLVKDDPRVKAAGTSLADTLMSGLKQDATVFIEPVLGAVDILKKSFLSAGGDISAIFRSAAQFVKPLAEGVGSAFKSIISGVSALVQGAQPVIHAIASGIAEVGGAIGDMFKRLSDDGASAGVAIGQVFHVIAAAIKVAGVALDALVETYGFLAKSGLLGPKLQQEFLTYSANAKIAAADTAAVKVAFDGATAGATAMSTAMSIATGMATAMATANHSLFDSETNVGEALDNVTESIKKHGRSLDSNSEKGRANRTALSGLATALNANYEAYVKVNGAGRGADVVAAKNYTSFIKSARAFGLSASEAADLAHKMGLIPPKKDVKVNTNTLDAINKIKNFEARMKALKDKWVTIHITTVGSASMYQKDNADKLKYAHGGVRGAATGGMRDGLTWVGEEGPELVDLPTGSNVHTTGDSRRMVGASAVSQAGPTINLYVQGSIRSDRDLVALIRNEFQRGGFRGVVNAA